MHAGKNLLEIIQASGFAGGFDLHIRKTDEFVFELRGHFQSLSLFSILYFSYSFRMVKFI